MNLEKRLQSAAAETNEVARNTVPRGFGAEPSTIRPWLAFAAAFAVVVAVIGIPWALGNLTQAPANDILVGAEDTSTTLAPDPTTSVSTEPAECSADELPVPTTAPPDGEDLVLPDPVAETAFVIAAAAQECNDEVLARFAGEGFTHTFGTEGIDFSRWEENDLYVTLFEVLQTTHGEVAMPNGERLFVWPAAFAYDSWDDVPDEFVDQLLRIHTGDEIASFAEFGVYAGWRTGITESGDWIFFVAGD